MTEKRLLVLRHGKSSWEDPTLEDHDRPLAPRGEKAAKAMGEHLRSSGIRPDQILCSSALRTRQTLERLSPSGEVLIEPELYSAGSSAVIDRLRRVPPGTGSVMVIGHNPAMQMLVLALAGAGETAPRESPLLAEVQLKFPTGALATLAFGCDWRELGPGRARLLACVRPKQLH